MSEPFLAEIRIMGFNFAPRGWALCDGQILPITQNQSLYSLLGTTYGGDGRTSFALPDLRSRTPISVGNGHQQGEKSGSETEQLSVTQMPQHGHALMGSSNAADTNNPSNSQLGAVTSNVYNNTEAGNLVTLATNALANVGANQGHENMQPFIALNFCIALLGLFPSRN